MSVDKQRLGDAGISTSENVSRRAFEKPKLLAKVLDLDVILVKSFRTVLFALNC